jgi:hypothetical protein
MDGSSTNVYTLLINRGLLCSLKPQNCSSTAEARRCACRPWDEAAATRFATVAADLHKAGTPIGSMDAMIAAHAIATGAVFVTNNRRQYGHERAAQGTHPKTSLTWTIPSGETHVAARPQGAGPSNDSQLNQAGARRANLHGHKHRS